VSREAARIQAVFFDFGGVVACIDHAAMRRIEQRHGLPEGGLWRAMYETPEWHALRVGHGDEKDWVSAIRRELSAMAGHDAMEEISQEWVECWRGLDRDMVDLINALRRRYRVGMISNATLTLEDELENHHGIYHLFEVVVNSARVGVAKPDVRIYLHAAEALGLEPAVCLHIDDLARNVAGAREAGFHALQYDGNFASLAASLRSLGLRW
jgi:putative hydrolase of the HAD superfamily